MMPSDVFLHHFRVTLINAYPTWAIYVGGGWNLFKQPVVLWEMENEEGHKRVGRYTLEPQQRFDPDHAVMLANRLIEAIRSENE